MIAELPPYGMPDNPVHNEVSVRYINEALEETGVLNMVTSIVWITGLTIQCLKPLSCLQQFLQWLLP